MSQSPDQPQMPGEGATDAEQESMVHLGRMMGDPRDDFDRQVEKHLQEANYEKMRAAEQGGVSGDIGPGSFEAQQAQQTQALQQQTSTAEQVQATQAQAGQMPISAPNEPPGPVGASQPYPAQQQPKGPPGAPGKK